MSVCIYMYLYTYIGYWLFQIFLWNISKHKSFNLILTTHKTGVNEVTMMRKHNNVSHLITFNEIFSFLLHPFISCLNCGNINNELLFIYFVNFFNKNQRRNQESRIKNQEHLLFFFILFLFSFSTILQTPKLVYTASILF